MQESGAGVLAESAVKKVAVSVPQDFEAGGNETYSSLLNVHVGLGSSPNVPELSHIRGPIKQDGVLDQSKPNHKC